MQTYKHTCTAYMKYRQTPLINPSSPSLPFLTPPLPLFQQAVAGGKFIEYIPDTNVILLISSKPATPAKRHKSSHHHSK